jgi:pyruvate kinase
MFTAAIRMLRQKGFIKISDRIAYLSGNLGKNAGTTFLEINPVRQFFDKTYEFHLPEYVADR